MSNRKYTETFGALLSPTDVRDYRLSAVCMAQQFPETFEVKMRPVKNQGAVGSCVAHSMAEIIEYHDYRQNKCTDKMSVGFIYGNRTTSDYKGSGMYPRDTLKAIQKIGDCYYVDFPENLEVPKIVDLYDSRAESLKDKAYPNRISTYFRVNTVAEIKSALMNYGPVAISIPWYNDMKVDSETGVIHSEMKGDSGCHCIVIYGWNENGWKIQNSWGTGWGKSGRAVLPYNFTIYEAWGITDDITNDGDIDKPYNSKIGEVIAKIFNVVINLVKGIFGR